MMRLIESRERGEAWPTLGPSLLETVLTGSLGLCPSLFRGDGDLPARCC
jgi:hypothetical protein